MTNDLAIKILTGDVLGTTEQTHEAVAIAVKALSARTDTDTVSRQDAIDALHGYFDGMLETDTWSPCDVYELIEILPSAQPECDDTVSRKAEIDAIKRYIRGFDAIDVNFLDGLKTAIQIIEQLPHEYSNAQNTLQRVGSVECEDTVSRQGAIDALEERLRANGYSNVALVSELNRIIGYLMRLPSAYQWIPCSERLPTKKTEVIYSLENHYVSTGYMTDRDYNGDKMELHWEDMESGALIYPEAWMPLPKPYEGSE